MSVTYHCSSTEHFHPTNMVGAKKTREVALAILDAGPRGISLEKLNSVVHPTQPIGTTRAYFSWDLPRKGLVVELLSTGNVRLVPPKGYSESKLYDLLVAMG